MKKALIFGATGFIGSYLLADLLYNSDYEKVIAVVRRDPGVNHPKLALLTGDLDLLPKIKDSLEADDVFIALGTTKKKTPCRAEYYRIDHDYPVRAAEIAKDKGATSVFLVSAINADANSHVFYLRTKGEAERDILALGYDHTHIFRPSLIMGTRREHRPMEKTLIAIWSILDPFFQGCFSRYKGMEAKEIAQAMNNAASYPAEKVTVYHWKEMHTLL